MNRIAQDIVIAGALLATLGRSWAVETPLRLNNPLIALEIDRENGAKFLEPKAIGVFVIHVKIDMVPATALTHANGFPTAGLVTSAVKTFWIGEAFSNQWAVSQMN